MSNLNAKTKRGRKILKFVQKAIPADEKQCSGHDTNHVLRVWKTGLQIGRNEKANIEVLEPALLLHDIKRPNDEKAEKNHAGLSVDYAENILKNFYYSDDEIREICESIKTHSRSSLTEIPKTIEAKIVYDADKQDGLGKKGVERAINLGKGRSWNTAQIAKWYLERICNVVKNRPFFTKSGIKFASKKLGFSLNWCKKNLPDKELRETLQKFGFNSLSDITLTSGF